jgi:hypothetical protein
MAAGERPRAMIRVECSGGTYIRSLVRDIGRELDMAATMTFLVRTRSGAFGLQDAVSVEEFAREPKLESLELVLNVCAESQLEDDEIALQLWQGKVVNATNLKFPSFHDQYRVLDYSDFHLLKARQKWIGTPQNRYVIYNSARTIFALAFVDEGTLRAEKVSIYVENNVFHTEETEFAQRFTKRDESCFETLEILCEPLCELCFLCVKYIVFRHDLEIQCKFTARFPRAKFSTLARSPLALSTACIAAIKRSSRGSNARPTRATFRARRSPSTICRSVIFSPKPARRC